MVGGSKEPVKQTHAEEARECADGFWGRRLIRDQAVGAAGRNLGEVILNAVTNLLPSLAHAFTCRLYRGQSPGKAGMCRVGGRLLMRPGQERAVLTLQSFDERECVLLLCTVVASPCMFVSSHGHMAGRGRKGGIFLARPRYAKQRFPHGGGV
jgi:hypothetical protein